MAGASFGIDLMKLKRNVAVFPLETPLEEVLERMLRAKFHMALVVDEFRSCWRGYYGEYPRRARGEIRMNSTAGRRDR